MTCIPGLVHAERRPFWCLPSGMFDLPQRKRRGVASSASELAVSAPWPTCNVTGQNVYSGKKLMVSNGVTVVTDRLGTVRGNTQGERFAYYTYGEERTSTVDGRDKFGTYFR